MYYYVVSHSKKFYYIKIYSHEVFSKIFGHPKDFFTSKTRLNFEEYGQAAKIIPEACEKRPLF